MQSIAYYNRHPKVLGNVLLARLCHLMPDKWYLKLKYHLWMGERLNLKDPQTFCEKLQWLKLYDRRPIYSEMVDKAKVKDYVASIIGKEFIIPTLGVWDSPDKINFDALPNRFVLKCNHNSGLGMYICKDKNKMDVEKVKAGLKMGLKQDYYNGSREWPYKDVHRCVLAEEYIEPAPNVNDLPDYKWYCFNGEPRFCQVIQDRNTCETIDFFDADWNHQDFVGLSSAAENAKSVPPRPEHLDTHLYIARELSKGIPFSRIDLYETNERVLFGEITFFPGGGFGSFRPAKYNEIIGSMIVLPR